MERWTCGSMAGVKEHMDNNEYLCERCRPFSLINVARAFHITYQQMAIAEAILLADHPGLTLEVRKHG